MKDSSPAVFYTYAEVLFIFAESAVRGWITADAETLYRAVIASLNQFGITDTHIIDSYLQQEGRPVRRRTLVQSIGWQWIAYMDKAPMPSLIGAGWVIPSFSLRPDSVWVPENYPVAFLSVTEQSLNGKQYQIAISRQGADEITTRLWFDVADKER